MPGSREDWLEKIKNTSVGKLIKIGDQQPRRWYMGADGKLFVSAAWKMWQEDYAGAYNELSADDLEWLNNIEYEVLVCGT
jgi:hypothetical protein